MATLVSPRDDGLLQLDEMVHKQKIKPCCLLDCGFSLFVVGCTMCNALLTLSLSVRREPYLPFTFSTTANARKSVLISPYGRPLEKLTGTNSRTGDTGKHWISDFSSVQTDKFAHFTATVPCSPAVCVDKIRQFV